MNPALGGENSVLTTGPPGVSPRRCFKRFLRPLAVSSACPSPVPPYPCRLLSFFSLLSHPFIFILIRNLHHHAFTSCLHAFLVSSASSASPLRTRGAGFRGAGRGSGPSSPAVHDRRPAPHRLVQPLPEHPPEGQQGVWGVGHAVVWPGHVVELTHGQSLLLLYLGAGVEGTQSGACL